jgi:hypothetical protein
MTATRQPDLKAQGMLGSLWDRVRAMTFLTWLLLVSAIANVATAISVATLASSRMEVYVRGGSLAVQGDVEIQNGASPIRVEVVR